MKKTIGFAASFLVSTALGAFTAALAAPGGLDDDVVHTHYDGVANDLLTAGLGKTGLGSPVPPVFVDPLHPTSEELRRLAIYNNYRALIDPTPGGGYGTLYGPNVQSDGTPTASEGKIAGDEYIVYEKGGGGRRNVTMMVQVPDSYDPSNGCIVTAPSSGSRGV
jgi:hydroxybutyrate-dimer hydrolase